MGKIAKHKKDLESLKQKDPEFYQFLEENDNSMLEFGEDDEDNDGEEKEDDEDDNEELFDAGNNEEDGDDDLEAIEFGSDDDEEEVRKPKTIKKKVIIESDIIDITSEMLDACIEKCHNTNSYLSIKKLLVYFRAACIPFNDNDSDDDDDNNTNNNKVQYTISSPEVYNEVMTKVLDNYHIIINNLFLSTASPTTTTTTTTTTKNKKNKANETALTSSSSTIATTYDFNQSDKHNKWKKYQSLIISFFKSFLSAISGIHNPTSANTQVGIFLLASLKDYISLLGCLPRLSRSVLKALLVIWSQGPVPAEDTGNLRGNALLRIRQVRCCIYIYIVYMYILYVYVVWCIPCMLSKLGCI